MGTIWVRGFKGGLDTRSLPETAPGGTLMRGTDGHINRGGEFEQRADFVEEFDLSAFDTAGLVSTPTGLYIFSGATPPDALSSMLGNPTSTFPGGLRHQVLALPGGTPLVSITSATLFKGKLAVVGEFSDGSRHIFYDGERVTDALAPPNAAGSGKPRVLATYREKLFATALSLLYTSAVGDPMDFGSGTGAGDSVIEMASHAGGTSYLSGLARFDDYLAVFSPRTIQIWFMDPDPALSRQVQVLDATGTSAPRSVTKFGDGDVFYLDQSGVRSLRSRGVTNSAGTIDVGSAIDGIILPALAETGATQVTRAVGLVEPRDGRFWLSLDKRIFVLSFFPSADISAWTEYKPGFSVDDMVVHGPRVWLRSGDKLYSYGGIGRDLVYSSDVRAEMWTPYLSADEPFRAKSMTGIDAAVRGHWDVGMAVDPLTPGAEDFIARLTESTYARGTIHAQNIANYVSLRFRSRAPESPTAPARVADCVIHFERDDKEDSGVT